MLKLLQVLGYIVHEWHTRTFKSEAQAIGDAVERLERQWCIPDDQQLLRAVCNSQTGHILDIQRTLLEQSNINLPLLALGDRLKQLVALGFVEATDCIALGKCVRIRYRVTEKGKTR